MNEPPLQPHAGSRPAVVDHRTNDDGIQELDAARGGLELDTDHAPETNGRMSVCRRCGAPTDASAGGHHVLRSEPQLARAVGWLRLEAHARRVARARAAHVQN